MKFTVALFREIYIENCIEVSNVFLERGEEIPFTIQNIAERDEYGQELVRWNRTFIFIIRKDILMQLCSLMKTKMKL